MHLGGQTEEISLIPYQIKTFEEQERQISERTSLVSARLEAAFYGRDADTFRDNTLASAWYRMHQGNPDHHAHTSEVGDQHLDCFATKLLNCRRVQMNPPRHRHREAASGTESHLPGYHQQVPHRHHPRLRLRKPSRLKRCSVKRTPIHRSSPAGTGPGRGYRHNGTRRPERLDLLR